MTSGSTGYFPNFTEVASAPDYHGPWTILGDAHPDDASRRRSGRRSAASSSTRDKKDLYIAMADRWLPQLPENMPNVYDSSPRRSQAAAADRCPGRPGRRRPTAMAAGVGENTAIADYVWLPIRFDGDHPVIEWLDEWRVEDFPAS